MLVDGREGAASLDRRAELDVDEPSIPARVVPVAFAWWSFRGSETRGDLVRAVMVLMAIVSGAL
jgi:hypothetical protein